MALVVAAAMALSGCGVSGRSDGTLPTAPVLPNGSKDQIASILGSVPNAQMGPDPARLVGRTVAQLEQWTGAPSLVRKEGQNEFRRYDLGGCRVYAVVAPAGGRVTSIATGPAQAGQPQPAFQQCTARTPTTGV